MVELCVEGLEAPFRKEDAPKKFTREGLRRGGGSSKCAKEVVRPSNCQATGR